jgi:hypothetical protein
MALPYTNVNVSPWTTTCNFFSLYPIQHLYLYHILYIPFYVVWNAEMESFGQTGWRGYFDCTCLFVGPEPGSRLQDLHLSITLSASNLPPSFDLQENITNGMENFHVGEQYQVVDVIGERGSWAT